VFGIAVFVFGRGEQLAPLSPRVSPTELPDTELTADDVRKVRFAMALRGYRMSDVDWALERVADELDRLRTQVAELSGSAVDRNGGSEPIEQRGSGEVLTGVSSLPTHGSNPAADFSSPYRPSGDES
jgi:DivIVA domain-containing protein